MHIYVENIQGFRGKFVYTLEEGLNVITSVFNGTGKTTFYECLKFLHNPAVLDKMNRKFLLNKNENKGVFMITLDDCQFGFILERVGEGKNSIVNYNLVSKLKNDEVFTYSQMPNPSISEYTEVFERDSIFINVCDRFMNLFSSSKTAYNHELVNAFLTNESLELSNERVGIELITAQQDYNYAIENYNHYNNLLKSSAHFDHADKFELLLDCEFEIQVYEHLDEILQSLKRCNNILPEININTLSYLYDIYNILIKIRQGNKLYSYDMIEIFLTLTDSLNAIKEEKPLISYNEIENLVNLSIV